MTKEQIMENAFQIVGFAGDARGCAMEAIGEAKDGNIDKANDLIKEARETIANAHHCQTELISAESSGEELPVSILLVHAQDHLMTAMTVIDLAEEMIDIHKKIN